MERLARPIGGTKLALGSPISFATSIISKYSPLHPYESLNVWMLYLKKDGKGKREEVVNRMNQTIYDFTYKMNYLQNVWNRQIHQMFQNHRVVLRNDSRSIHIVDGNQSNNEWKEFRRLLREFSGSELFELFQLYNRYSSNFTAMQNRLGKMVGKVVEKEKERQKVMDYTKMQRDYRKLVKRYDEGEREKFRMGWDPWSGDPNQRYWWERKISRTLERMGRDKAFTGGVSLVNKSFHAYIENRFYTIHKGLKTDDRRTFVTRSANMEHKRVSDANPRRPNEEGRNEREKEASERIRLRGEEEFRNLSGMQSDLSRVMSRLSSHEEQMREIQTRQERLVKESMGMVGLKQAKDEFMKEFKDSLWIEKMRRGLD